jgi:hypothetical protein
MNSVVWTAIGAALVWVGAAIKKLVDAGTPVTFGALLKEIFTFN